PRLLRRSPYGYLWCDHRPGCQRHRGQRHRHDRQDHARFPNRMEHTCRRTTGHPRMSRYRIDYSRYDESSVPKRPSKRGSRPRTKDRPAHEDAITGRVMTVDRGRYTIYLSPQRKTKTTKASKARYITAMRAREMRKTAIVVGDLVDVVGDVSGDEGTLGRIVRLQPRDTVLRRSADDTDAYERIVVANVDTLIIVVAAANPEPRTGFIDRAMVAAYDAGITQLLCITKTD